MKRQATSGDVVDNYRWRVFVEIVQWAEEAPDSSATVCACGYHFVFLFHFAIVTYFITDDRVATRRQDAPYQDDFRYFMTRQSSPCVGASRGDMMSPVGDNGHASSCR